MAGKKSPIEQHKKQDLILGREELLKIINDPATTSTAIKNKIEAIKLLARMHKALQVDKIVAKADATASSQAASLPPEEMQKLQTEVDEILGRTTATETAALNI